MAFGHEIWSQVEDERRARGEVVVEAVEMSEEMERKRREEAVAALPVICQREGARDERDEESRFVARIKATYKEANYDFDKDEDDLYGA